ncbi:diguanylate cyclase (GGDEF domain) with PAS/PAC sensor [Alteromonas macleodii]|jgi:diguanylate cyclase (GGDEF)-like protein|uniref:sensor domain-containing diguanylate cyclase n=1 Tax=Alteromonas TaxID=226 RepID=UPI00057F0F95|nr:MULTISPECIES: sensor domain-containing diguanylate cyclase [Alteromonas]MAC09280.1 sensor domain-containing diguanylate cyclase [Alteromonas sp.]KHT56854.1 diguanylate cyclase [Alteromonas macleodii]MCP3704460.1 GGDEF domain-containing protein [Alteromonas sp.]TAP26628.1 sensor domain-containing diguanylate cyclase [Alteromonas sp. KUL17]GEA02926.1 diguanylate cyclase [Alteromonas sp. KUL17]|tara:strand:+ start:66 stop:1055 length:990 start_codon:yes stop_codon:yes gene_type:complete
MNASTDALSTGALVNSSQVPAELLDSIEVGIAVLDRNFKVQVWNKFLENHGAKKAEAIIGDSLFSHFPEIEEKWLRTKVDPVFNLKSPVFIIWEQRPYLFKFGCNRPVTSAAEFMYQNVTMFPIVDKRGNVERFCMLVYDVTEQALGKRGMEHLNEELKTASRVDGLTGLYNRRYWQERFDEMHKLCVRREKPSTALMLDIDHFKRINDTYGHQAGDKVIKMLAALIKRCVRETDLAGRYGGEEFAIILNDSSVEDAKIVAERIRQLAQRLVVEHEGESISFTVSLGLAQFSPDFKGAMAWLECADQALYEAKENGRNQYRIYAAPGAL